MTTAKGYNGTISFDGRKVIIERTGFVARSSQGSGTKMIPLGQIVGLQWKKAGLGTRGYIEVSTAGSGTGRQARPQGLKTQNLDNENAVAFGRRAQPAMRAVYNEIMTAL